MNIIIAGDGKLGYALADFLSNDGHDVTIIDRDQQVLDRAADTLDVMCIRGNAANARTLLEAGVDTADIMISVTTHDEINMVCCLAAKQLGAKYSIARIRDPEYTESLVLLQSSMGIDLVINPERAAALEISRLLRFPFAINIESFAHGQVEMVEFRAKEGERIVNRPLRELSKNKPEILYCAIDRDQNMFIPNGDSVILPEDKVYVVGHRNVITEYFKSLGKDTRQVRTAMLLGGGYISYYLAKILSGMGIALTILEINPEKCTFLSEALDDEVNIIHGDATDRELLDSENMSTSDALVALIDRDEENLITGLYAVHSGVDKVIAKVNRINYMDLLGDLGIDSIISPKLTTANLILRTVRARSQSEHSPVEKIYRIANGKIEALEFTAEANARFLNIPLNKLDIAPEVLVAALERNRRIIIPFGSDHIEAGDTVLLVAETGKVVLLEDAFV